jgi:hypothetical protein
MSLIEFVGEDDYGRKQSKQELATTTAAEQVSSDGATAEAVSTEPTSADSTPTESSSA